MSQEERIRKAEEIYYRRKAQGVRVSTSSVNAGKANKVSLGKKMVIQILVCLVIYCAFWFMQGKTDIVSQNLLNNTRQILNYDINLVKLYNDSLAYFNSNFNNIIKNNINEVSQPDENTFQGNEVIQQNENSLQSNETQQSVESQLQQNEVIEELTDVSNGIGGGNEDITVVENQDKTQMEIDAEYVKQNCNLIIPVQGYVTSRFGNREPTEIISAFHQGIDIGAVIGTPIHAAMEGTVVASSLAGDYGNHIKIQNGDILTVYAHCSELNVSVGEYVSQNQIIGKVGNTGKVTGPHLHFEIRRQNRYIDPDMILNFN